MRFLHHIGSFLLLAATVFLIITSISAPVINNIGILTVNLPDSISGSEVSFGSFGYCVQDARGNDKDTCSKSKVGYSPAAVMERVDRTDFSTYETTTTKALTYVMVLHPVAACLSFIAFLLALGAGMIGSFLASLVAALAFIVTLIVLVCDFVGFTIIKSTVNDRERGSHAYLSVGMWCVLVAAICTFLATILLFVTCCTSRIKKRRQHGVVKEEHHDSSMPMAPKRKFWQRRAKV